MLDDAARPGPRPRRRDRVGDHGRGLRVEVRRRLVEDQQRRVPHQRPGQRDAALLAGRQPPAAVADPRVVAAPELRDELGGAGQRGGLLDPPARPRRSGRPSRCCRGSCPGTASAAAAARRPAAATRPGRASPRSWPSTVTRPAVRAPAARAAATATVLLPAPLGPTSATTSPRRSSRSNPSSTGRPGPARRRSPRRSRTTSHQAGQPAGRRAAGRVRRRSGRGCARPRPARRRWRGTARPAPRSGAYSSGVSSSTVSAARRLDRRRRSAGAPSVTATSAVRERRHQVQHGAGQERHPEHLHGGRAGTASRARLDPVRLRLAPVERAQRRQPPHDVQEVVREPRQRPPPRPGPGLASNRPISAMNTGISGSVTSMISADVGSITSGPRRGR